VSPTIRLPGAPILPTKAIAPKNRPSTPPSEGFLPPSSHGYSDKTSASITDLLRVCPPAGTPPMLSSRSSEPAPDQTPVLALRRYHVFVPTFSSFSSLLRDSLAEYSFLKCGYSFSYLTGTYALNPSPPLIPTRVDLMKPARALDPPSFFLLSQLNVHGHRVSFPLKPP